jgi:hypothetical protein
LRASPSTRCVHVGETRDPQDAIHTRLCTHATFASTPPPTTSLIAAEADRVPEVLTGRTRIVFIETPPTRTSTCSKLPGSPALTTVDPFALPGPGSPHSAAEPAWAAEELVAPLPGLRRLRDGID